MNSQTQAKPTAAPNQPHSATDTTQKPTLVFEQYGVRVTIYDFEMALEEDAGAHLQR